LKAVELTSFGIPHEVCRCIDADGVGAPVNGEIIVEIEASPVNPADLLTIQGKYPGPTELPARLGIEGTGRITAVGQGVSGLAVGDRVISLARTNWTQRIKLKADLALKVPGNVDVLQVAMLKANPPTAYLMLWDYVTLKPGDWVVQNAANSGVGRHVIRLAKARGIHTVNLVRRESLVDELKAIGADVRVKAETGGAEIKLGIDAIGGEASTRIADCLADGGTVVNYGFLGDQPCVITPHQTILHDITLKGFWLVKYMRQMPRSDIEAMYGELCERMADGTLYVPVEATYGLEDINKALAHAERESRGGKILLTPNGAVD
jgi:NADPH:quinone reductase-like Zn-dependent oxidoreductase